MKKTNIKEKLEKNEYKYVLNFDLKNRAERKALQTIIEYQEAHDTCIKDTIIQILASLQSKKDDAPSVADIDLKLKQLLDSDE